MLDVVAQLLSAKAKVEQTPGASVTISLDLRDPNTQKLAAFAKKLMLPTTKIHASGLVTKTGIAIPERADEFIEALRKVVGDEIMDDLATDLNAQIQLEQGKVRREAISDTLHSTKAMGTVFDGILRDDFLRGDADVTTLGNMVGEMLESSE